MITVHTDSSPLAKAIVADLTLRNIEHICCPSSVFYIEDNGLIIEDPFCVYTYLTERYPTGYIFTPAPAARNQLLYLQLCELIDSIDEEDTAPDDVTALINTLPIGNSPYLLGNKPHPLDAAVAMIMFAVPTQLAAPHQAYKNRLRRRLRGSRQ